MVFNPEYLFSVAQVSKSAVPPISKSASPSRFGNLRHGRLGSLRYAKQIRGLSAPVEYVATVSKGQVKNRNALSLGRISLFGHPRLFVGSSEEDERGVGAPLKRLRAQRGRRKTDRFWSARASLSLTHKYKC